MEPYDSPTFLGNKDKLLLGMTIGQIGVFMGSGLLWLMIALAAEFSTLKSLLIFGPAHALTVAFLMVKLSGIALPMYLLAMLSSLVASAVYHVDAVGAREGLPDWFDATAPAEAAAVDVLVAQVEEDGVSSRRWLGALRFFRRKAAATATATANSRVSQETRTLASLEVEQRSNDAARGVQRSLRTVFRMVVKGHA